MATVRTRDKSSRPARTGRRTPMIPADHDAFGTPDHLRRLSDKILAAFNHAYATGEVELARQLRAESGAGAAPGGEPSKTSLPKGKLQVLSGGFAGKQLELTKALTTLGRPGVQVAAITRRADGFYVMHVESGPGQGFPTVNGKEIGAEARKLNDNDVIELAGVKMGFYSVLNT